MTEKSAMTDTSSEKTAEQVIADFMTDQRFDLHDNGWLHCSDSNAGFRPSDLVDALREAGFEITKGCNHQWESCSVNEAGERIRVSGHNLGIYATGVFCVHCGKKA